MVGDDDESYFPRGGTSKTVMKKNSFVFGPKKKKGDQEPTKKPGKRERLRMKQQRSVERPGNVEEEEEDDDDANGVSELVKLAKREGSDVSAERRSRSKKVQLLSYQNIVEDMLVLCTVNNTHNGNRIQVHLPERLFCSVSSKDANLVEMFGKSFKGWNCKSLKPGSFLVCKIKSCTVKQGSYEVMGSINPADVYNSLTFSDIHVGSVFVGAIKEIEDYGFLVFSGIRGVTAFLPFDSCVDPEKAKAHFRVGKLVFCVVVQSKLGDASNAVQLSLKPEDFKSHRISGSDLTPVSVLPGMELDLTVTKHLGGDLEVRVDGTEVRGFVPRTHFRTLADEESKFKIGSKVKGNVLYKLPVSNIVACSLRVNPLIFSKGQVESGAVFEQAEIVYHDKRGIGVKFDHKGETCFGVISKRKMEGAVDPDKLEETFPRGNHLSVVVTGYHNVDQLYSCSTENELLSGAALGASNKEEMVGRLVTVVVKEKKDSGLVVTCGSTKAFVPKDHVSDVVDAKNIMNTIQIDSKLKGRVFQYDKNKNFLIVTLRPTLVSGNALVDFAKANKGDAYWGVVNSIFDTGINVLFFNNLKANIDQENLVRHSRKYRMNELVKCFVIKAAETKGTHRAQPPVFSLLRPLDQMLLSIGTSYKMIVKAKSATAIECLLEERKNLISVSIPLQHLSDFESLRKKVLEKLTPGSTLDAHLFCFDRDLHPVFTLRESVKQFFKIGGSSFLAKGYAALKPDDLVPVIISEEIDDGYYVSVPVPKFNRKILVDRNVFTRLGSVSVGDVIWMVVIQVHHENQNLILAYPDPQIYGKQLLKWAASNLMNYLNEAASFQTFKTGQKVSAVGKGVKNQCELSDGRVGMISSVKPVTYPAGQPVSLIFVEDDFEKHCVHLLAQRSSSKGNQPGANAGSHKPHEVVFTSEIFYVCRSDSGAYSLCPRFLQPNSAEPDLHIDKTGPLELHEMLPYDNGLTIACPSLQIFDRIGTADAQATAEKSRKKRSLGSVSGKLGGAKKKAKTTLVKPTNSVKTSGKFRNKKKKKLKPAMQVSSAIIPNPLLNSSEY